MRTDKCYIPSMEANGQRETHGMSDDEARTAELGHVTSVKESSFIASLVPLDSRQPQIATARKPTDFDVTKLKPAAESSSELLEGLREDR